MSILASEAAGFCAGAANRAGIKGLLAARPGGGAGSVRATLTLSRPVLPNSQAWLSFGQRYRTPSSSAENSRCLPTGKRAPKGPMRAIKV